MNLYDRTWLDKCWFTFSALWQLFFAITFAICNSCFSAGKTHFPCKVTQTLYFFNAPHTSYATHKCLVPHIKHYGTVGRRSQSRLKMLINTFNNSTENKYGHYDDVRINWHSSVAGLGRRGREGGGRGVWTPLSCAVGYWGPCET